MDTSLICLTLIVLLLIYLLKYFFRCGGKADPGNLRKSLDMLGLSKKEASILRLDKEKELLAISALVVEKLDHAVTIYVEEEDIIQSAYIDCVESTKLLKIGFEQEKEGLLRELIESVFTNVYKPLLEEVWNNQTR